MQSILSSAAIAFDLRGVRAWLLFLPMTQGEAQEHLTAWLAADKALAVASSYTVAGQTLTRADGPHIRAQITYWQRVVDSFSATAAGNRRPGIMTPNFSR